MKIKEKRRFFFHYRKCDGKMSVHFKGQCIPCDNIDCKVPVETHRNRRQPKLVMRGYCSNIIVDNNKVVIE